MSQCKYTTNKQEWTSLSLEERKLIEKYRRQGFSVAKISVALGRHRSTIYRELKKGSVEQIFSTKGYNKYDPPYETKLMYFHDVGQRKTDESHMRRDNKYKLLIDPEFIKYVEKKILEERRAPDIIIGRLKREEYDFKNLVCPKTMSL